MAQAAELDFKIHAILLLAVLVGAGCASGGSKRTEGGGLPSGKATVEVIENRVALEAQVAYAPRRFQEMESSVLLSSKVQDCLRGAPDIREAAFVVGLEGILTFQGAVEQFNPSTPTESLGTCLTHAIKSVSFGRGKTGPFKMQVMRSKPPADPSKKPKGVLLDLTTVKKWE